MDTPEQSTGKAWYLGNTSVREAQRLRAGLVVLKASTLNDNLEGKTRDRDLALLLNETGVLKIQDAKEENIGFLGRKWRAAWMQLGFITPSSKLLAKNGIKAIIPYSVTENGRRLIGSTSLPAQQECFLRSLLALQLPSPVEEFEDGATPFSPLRIVLEVLCGLDKAHTEANVSKVEMAAVVEVTTNSADVPAAVEHLIRFREKMAKEESLPKRNEIERVFLGTGNASQTKETLLDYADSNFRYLRLTGLFKVEKNGLGLAPHRRTLIEAILATPFQAREGKDYLERFWKGAEIPTDNRVTAIAEARETARALELAGLKVALPWDLDQLGVADAQRILHDLQEHLLRARERAYAIEQRNQWENIAKYLDDIISGGKAIPSKEGPAYFEWVIWRAFLAINTLINEPWECRNFEVYEGPQPYESFLPVGCAGSGRPDLVFEFKDFVLVVEVTLSSSSRQEAAEGEPVRRHVADLCDAYAEKKKRVYGLFLALSVNTNTAETFRVAKWYRTKDDSEQSLKIVPLTLKQFANLFMAPLAKKGALDPKVIEDLLRDCLAESNAPAPAWKSAINESVDRFVTGRLSASA
jgi:hypothetical protein